jgi:hypothetical protein
MEQVIWLLVVALFIALAGYGMYYVCIKFALPKPVLWVCGVVLLIAILLFVGKLLGVNSIGPIFTPRN